MGFQKTGGLEIHQLPALHIQTPLSQGPVILRVGYFYLHPTSIYPMHNAPTCPLYKAPGSTEGAGFLPWKNWIKTYGKVWVSMLKQIGHVEN